MEDKDALTALSWGALCHLKDLQSDQPPTSRQRPPTISSRPSEIFRLEKNFQKERPLLCPGSMESSLTRRIKPGAFPRFGKKAATRPFGGVLLAGAPQGRTLHPGHPVPGWL